MIEQLTKVFLITVTSTVLQRRIDPIKFGPYASMEDAVAAEKVILAAVGEANRKVFTAMKHRDAFRVSTQMVQMVGLQPQDHPGSVDWVYSMYLRDAVLAVVYGKRHPVRRK